jgi:serine/threonine protein kinase
MNGTANLADIAARLCTAISASLIRPIANGAFKQAFLIEKSGQARALKIARISDGLRSRFERETEALRGCSHPSIATLHDCFSYADGEVVYWVTIEEYLAGGTLDTRRQLAAISHHELRAIGIALAEALAHLHERGLVHRDIKPANILFREDMSPVLTDFGLVRVLDATSLTEDFVFQGPGTPFYAAPEQLNNDKASIDWRTDQFGLAVVLTECGLGYHPYSLPGMTRQEVVLSVAGYDDLPSTTAEELKKVGFGGLIRALQPWPISRYRWPSDLIRALSGEDDGRVSPNGS